MTMYLPNSAVRPTGFEAGEFIEVPDALDQARGDNPSDESGRDNTPSSPKTLPRGTRSSGQSGS